LTNRNHFPKSGAPFLVRERRSAVRIQPRKNDPIRIDLNGENFLDIVYAVDISTGGLGLWVPHHFEGCKIDSLVDCLVRLPYPISSSFHAQGSIRHIRGNCFGLKFHNLHENAKNLIKKYIEYRLKDISWLAWITHRMGLLSITSRILNW